MDEGEFALYPSKVEICGLNTAKIKVLKETEKMELLKKYAVPLGAAAAVLLILVVVLIKRKKKKAGMDDEIL